MHALMAAVLLWFPWLNALMDDAEPHPVERQPGKPQHASSRKGVSVVCTNPIGNTVAGCVIARQRPGTANGFIFLSVEDETGISNAIIDPELYERNRSLLTYARFLLVEGILQNIDNVIHIRAKHIEELNVTTAPTQSHDFH